MNKIETQVLRLIGENASSPDVFADNDSDLAPIRDSINDAIQEICMLYGGYTEKFHIPMVTDKIFYRLTFKRGYMGWVQDAWSVIRKVRLKQTSMIALEHDDPLWMTHTGYPEQYFQVGSDVVGFASKPSSTTDVIELTCAVIPANYTKDIDRIKVRDTFQWGIVNYAVSEYWAGRGDAQEAAKHIAMYMDNLGVTGLYKPRDSSPYLRTEKVRENVSGVGN